MSCCVAPSPSPGRISPFRADSRFLLRNLQQARNHLRSLRPLGADRRLPLGLLGGCPRPYASLPFPFGLASSFLTDYSLTDSSLTADLLTTLAEHHDSIYIKGNDVYVHASPTVRYRGFFLNDEQPSLTNWAVERYGTNTSAPFQHEARRPARG